MVISLFCRFYKHLAPTALFFCAIIVNQPMTKSILIKGGTIVTMDEPDSIVRGDVLIRDGRIAKIGGEIDETVHDVIEAHGCAVLPGFVQTHIHLCQTLFRGAADDLALIDWLKKRVWRMEAAHTSDTFLQ